MKILSVHTARPYDVIVTHGWQQLNINANKVCIISDTNVAPLYLDAVRNQICAKQIVDFVLPAGESSKNGTNFLAACAFLAQHGFTREDMVVALGGGVVGDLAGFVAASYMRGVRVVQLPTTLLAMIDSSVGGKTGIDLAEGKNLVGAFHQPSLVYVNVDTLKTLPRSEYSNGLGEAVKYAFLSTSVTEDMFNDPERLVCACLAIKIDIVQHDEHDHGRRMLLNLGHTVGHAIEVLYGYTVPHGLCVAKGLLAAVEISQKLLGLDEQRTAKLKKLAACCGHDLSVPFTKKQLLDKILQDKKAVADGVNFVVIEDVGNCCVQNISATQLEQLL